MEFVELCKQVGQVWRPDEVISCIRGGYFYAGLDYNNITDLADVLAYRIEGENDIIKIG